ncbi:MAG TPA: hypothetical protein VH054_00950, partial [Polyangiaceae bacterium]|nr:hypothetical protein [Polyangiaceae bacterium]
MKRPLTIALALTLASVPAHAFDDSTRKPFYLQSAVGSFSYWPVLFQNQSYWKPDLEFGVHFT